MCLQHHTVLSCARDLLQIHEQADKIRTWRSKEPLVLIGLERLVPGQQCQAIMERRIICICSCFCANTCFRYALAHNTLRLRDWGRPPDPVFTPHLECDYGVRASGARYSLWLSWTCLWEIAQRAGRRTICGSVILPVHRHECSGVNEPRAPEGQHAHDEQIAKTNPEIHFALAKLRPSSIFESSVLA